MNTLIHSVVLNYTAISKQPGHDFRYLMFQLKYPYAYGTKISSFVTLHLGESPVTVNDICKWTNRDPFPSLAPIFQLTKQGWPHKCDFSLSPYSSHNAELSIPIQWRF